MKDAIVCKYMVISRYIELKVTDNNLYDRP